MSLKAHFPDDGPRPHVLLVDDEAHIRVSLTAAIRSLGYNSVNASSSSSALDLILHQRFDMLLTDLRMPGMDGIELMKKALAADSTISVVMMTGNGTIEAAVEAMKLGAEDFLLKPVELNTLEVLLAKISQKRHLVRENRRLTIENQLLKNNIDVRYHLTTMLGTSEPVQELNRNIKRYLKFRMPVLFVGEPGSQLTDVAKILHYNSPWNTSSLIHFDCSAVPKELHLPQLFGNEESEVTGIRLPSQPGLVERAHLGTLIISNIDKLEKSCQPSLSHVFKNKMCQRSGGSQFYGADVKIIGTVHQENFRQILISDGIRWDVWEYMQTNVIKVPPLRERLEDLNLLLLATAKKLGHLYEKNIERIDPAVTLALSSYKFPGNMRELEAFVEAAVLKCSTTTLTSHDFILPTE